jgi:hypothetical protein
MQLWIGCIAGALEESEFKRLLADVGFADIDVEPTRIYEVDDARTFLSGAGVDVEAVASAIEGRFMSAFVRATKPGAATTTPSTATTTPCCPPGCC